MELTTLVKMHGTKVPVVISSCIEEVEKRGRLLDHVLAPSVSEVSWFQGLVASQA